MQKKIFQIIIPDEENNSIPESNENLLEGKIIERLSIHALPGTAFGINIASNQEIVIGPGGNYSLDCSEFPITKLYLTKHNATIYPIIIDMEGYGE